MNFNQQQALNMHTFGLKLKQYFPAIFFFGGFIWDALTIGKRVQSQDLWIFSTYLVSAALIIYLLSVAVATQQAALEKPHWFRSFCAKAIPERLPYFLLQFLFGSLLSALFFLYSQSAGHGLAWLVSFLLGCLLVANEFLEDHYKRATLSWALFGLCAMLLFNFVLPFVIGSIHAIWFYLSTLLGLVLTYALYRAMPYKDGSLMPVNLIAGLLVLAYLVDMIPPVPLVKRDIQMAYSVEKSQGRYWLTQEKSPFWVFWRKTSDDLAVSGGQRIVCFSSVFAPSGLTTRLVHNWQLNTQKGWVTQSRAGFTLSGGRGDGYRSYTYKSNPQAGDWRVILETEEGKTLAVKHFEVSAAEANSSAHTITLGY